MKEKSDFQCVKEDSGYDGLRRTPIMNVLMCYV